MSSKHPNSYNRLHQRTKLSVPPNPLHSRLPIRVIGKISPKTIPILKMFGKTSDATSRFVSGSTDLVTPSSFEDEAPMVSDDFLQCCSNVSVSRAEFCCTRTLHTRNSDFVAVKIPDSTFTGTGPQSQSNKDECKIRDNSEGYMRSEENLLSWKQQFLGLLKRATPAVLAFGASTIGNTLAFVFIGASCSAVEQGAHGLGYSLGNILVVMVGFGLLNGLDTLCPAAIGSGCPWLCWRYLFQALSFVAIAFALVLPLLLFTSPVLIAFGQEGHVAVLCQIYLKASIPGLIALCVFEAERKFLIHHRAFRCQAFLSCVSVAMQGFFLWDFVTQRKLGPYGAGMARSCTWVITTTFVSLYIFMNRNAFGWKEFKENSRQLKADDSAMQQALNTRSSTALHTIKYNKQSSAESLRNGYFEVLPNAPHPPPLFHKIACALTHLNFTGLYYYLKVAFPALLLCVFEWLSFEIQVFEAAWLGAAELASLSAAQAIGSLFFVLSQSVAVVACSDTGRALGARSIKGARRAGIGGILVVLCVIVPIAITVSLFHTSIAQLYSSETEVQRALGTGLPWLSFLVIADALHVVLGGTLKALNKQWIGVLVDGACLVTMMQLLGLLFAYKCGLKAAGFLMATTCGLVCSDCLVAILLFCNVVDWGSNCSPANNQGAGATDDSSDRTAITPRPDPPDQNNETAMSIMTTSATSNDYVDPDARCSISIRREGTAKPPML